VRFQYVNLLGVLVLGCLGVIQWRVNRDLNLETQRLEQLHLDQQAQLEERDRSIRGYRADLDQFRDQLTRTRQRLKETDASLAAARHELAQLARERDQLRIAVTNWADAVAARDARLEEAAGQLEQLAADRNEAVRRHNELAEILNETIGQLNDRTRQFNELIERHQNQSKP
jgi:methyl-accepting chemotaxis protein